MFLSLFFLSASHFLFNFWLLLFFCFHYILELISFIMFRMKTQFLFRSMWTFLKIKMHLLVHRLELWFRNRSRLMFSNTQLVILLQRMLLSCIVRLRAYFVSVQQQDVPPHSLVCLLLLFSIDTKKISYILKFRSYIDYPLCFIFSYRFSSCHWIWRYKCTSVGPRYRNSFTCTFWS